MIEEPHKHGLLWRILFWPIVVEDTWGHSVVYVVAPVAVMLNSNGYLTLPQLLGYYLGLGVLVTSAT